MTPAQAIRFILGRSLTPDTHIADLVETVIECRRRLEESPRIKDAMAAAVLALVTDHTHPVPVKGMTYRQVSLITAVPKSTLKDLADAARRARAAVDNAAIAAAGRDDE